MEKAKFPKELQDNSIVKGTLTREVKIHKGQCDIAFHRRWSTAIF